MCNLNVRGGKLVKPETQSGKVKEHWDVAEGGETAASQPSDGKWEGLLLAACMKNEKSTRLLISERVRT